MKRTQAWATVVSLGVLLACESHPPTSAAISPVLHEAQSTESGRYIVVFHAERVAESFGERVARLGGTVELSLGGIGVVAVSGLTAAAAAELATEPGVGAVEDDVMGHADEGALDAPERFADPRLADVLTSADATSVPTSALFYPRQWNLRAVFADVAWANGHLGSRDVVVAILDSGIDYLHVDLEGLVDLTRSVSFAQTDPDDPVLAARFPGRLPIADLRGHGTAMAALVGSNATQFAAVNRDVTFLAVKIWNRFGLGPISQLLSGIVYAADWRADVINVSGTYNIDQSENPGTIAAVQRAVNYAFRKGTLLVAVAGNDAGDLDHNGDMVRMPCEAANSICASATGPTSAAGVNGPWENVDASTDYTGFGRSAVDVAAPGGAAAMFRRVWLPCTTTATEFAFAPACRPGTPLPPGQPFPMAQCQGTSCSAAHTTGLAALLVAQLGHGNPALIRARILQAADDLGEAGHDPYYGAGRINIARALGLIDP